MWYRQPIKQKRFYHATPSRLKVGDMLDPRQAVCHDKNYEWCGDFIYMTSEPAPHYTVVSRSIRENWDIYEIKPTGKVFFGTTWDEYLTKQPVEVIHRIGSARGLAGGGSKPHDQETKGFYLDKIKELNNILKDPKKTKEYMDEYNRDPHDEIEKYKWDIMFGKTKSSKVLSRNVSNNSYDDTEFFKYELALNSLNNDKAIKKFQQKYKISPADFLKYYKDKMSQRLKDNENFIQHLEKLVSERIKDKKGPK